MRVTEMKKGTVVFINDLFEKHNILAEPEYLNNRAEKGTSGVLRKPLTHDNSVWWVEHEGGVQAPYWYSELVKSPGNMKPEWLEK